MELQTNPPLTPDLRAALIELWSTVANAGGAVGLVAPTSPEAVAALAEPAFARVERGDDDLVVAFDDGRPVGFGFLATNDNDLTAHWATVSCLQRAPSRAGQGVGGRVLDLLEAAARRRGLVRLTLTTRGETGSEGFYLARGYRLDARMPDRLRVGGGRLVEELHLSKPLRGDAGRARLPVKRLDPQLPLPRYAHPGDAGLDLYAREAVMLAPGERALVPTGIAVAIPPDHVGLVHPRSGLAARHGVTLVNAPGTIDAGYRGEIKVIVANTDAREPVALERGCRIAQLLIQRVETVEVVAVDALPGTVRGEGGFGSTGA
ncbi:MAG TPA: dUTP diphosphatase [Euzebyales bacterium]|nr:dUTP diphosphatase [Euzebyales bacterium]